MSDRWGRIIAGSKVRAPERIIRAFVLALTLAAASTAFAYWRSPGAGSGAATTGTSVAVTLSVGSPTAALYPGGQGDVALTIDNPNSFRVHVGSLSLATGQGTGGYAVDSGHTGCATSVLSFTTQTNGSTGWNIPPKVGSTNGSLAVDLSSALAMSASAADACQGATFSVYLSAGP